MTTPKRRSRKPAKRRAAPKRRAAVKRNPSRFKSKTLHLKDNGATRALAREVRKLGEVETVTVKNSRNASRDDFSRSKATVTLKIRRHDGRQMVVKGTGYGRLAEEANDYAIDDVVDEVTYLASRSKAR